MSQEIEKLEQQTKTVIWIGGGFGIAAALLPGALQSGTAFPFIYDLMLPTIFLLYAGGLTISIIEFRFANRLSSAYVAAGLPLSVRAKRAKTFAILGFVVAGLSALPMAIVVMNVVGMLAMLLSGNAVL